MRSARHVAAILAAMFIEFGQPRMRITEKTLRSLGPREQLRESHKAEVRNILEDYFGLSFIEIPRGFCIMKLSSLNGTRQYTFRAFRLQTSVDYRSEEAVWAHAISQLAEAEPDESEEE